MIKRQFTLYAENKPGALSRITRLLAGARINIEGVSTAISGDVGLIQVVTSNSARTARILKRARVPYTIQKVLVETLPDKAGSLATITEKLAARNININYLYSTCSACGSNCSVIVSGDNLKAIEKIWKQHVL